MANRKAISLYQRKQTSDLQEYRIIPTSKKSHSKVKKNEKGNPKKKHLFQTSPLATGAVSRTEAIQQNTTGSTLQEDDNRNMMINLEIQKNEQNQQ